MGRFLKVHKADGGFTLIELMVVVLILGILVAFAVPIYQSAQTSARLHTCQSNLRTMDSAIQNFICQDQASPGSLDDLVPGYMAAIPPEPARGSYSLVETNNARPPHAECSAGHTY